MVVIAVKGPGGPAVSEPLSVSVKDSENTLA